MNGEGKKPTLNVTGRDRRVRQRLNVGQDNENNDDFRQNMLANVAKRNQQKAKNVTETDEDLRKRIHLFLEQSGNEKKKVNNSNCFETKTPLDMFRIEDMVKTDVKIQDLAIVLDSTQQIYGCRVDRLLHDCIGAFDSLSSRSTNRDQDPVEENEEQSEAAKARKKKKAENCGIAAVEQALQNYDLGQQERDENEDDEEMDQLMSGDEHDESANDGIENMDWNEDCNIERKISELVAHRKATLEKEVFNERIAAFNCIDEKPIELQNTDVDWLKTNPYYQKAVMGCADDITSSFHSLMYNGLYSNDGRVFKLHPRITDSEKDFPINPSEADLDVVSNMRNIIANAMDKSPMTIPNNLMLEVTNRPKTGQYRLVRTAAKPAESTTTIAESNDGQELNDLTVMIPTTTSAPAPISNDMTIFDSDVVGPMEIESSATTSEQPPAHQVKSAMRTVSMVSKEETTNNGMFIKAPENEALPYDDILMDDSIFDVLPMNRPFPTSGLEYILDHKTNLVDEEEDETKKVWKRGYLAEEWQDNQADLNREILNVIESGIDSYVKGLDYMVNSEVVKIIYNKESLINLEVRLQNREFDENSMARKKPELPDKYFILKPSETYLKLFPQDRKDHFERIDDDEQNIPISEEHDEDQDNDADVDFYDGGGDIQFDEGLVAPINDDIAPMTDRENQGEDDHVANAFFGGVAEENETIDRETEASRIAIAPEELPGLITCGPPEEVAGARPEIEAEIRNLGKDDNSHWKAGSVGEHMDGKQQTRKRRDKKIRKKIGVDDFLSYFEPTTDVDQVEKISSIRCQEVRPSTLQLKESQIYSSESPTELKPHIAFEFESLGKSGLLFKKKYGKLRFERVDTRKSKNDDILIDDMKGVGNVDSDCLQWLLSFNGFRCAYQADHDEAETAASYDNDDDGYAPMDDNTMAANFDDNFENRRNSHHKIVFQDGRLHEKLDQYVNEMKIRMGHGRKLNEYMSDSEDDDYDEMGQRRDLRAKNLDAAKHKKCIAGILNTSKFSMPNLQHLLEQLSVETSNQPSTSTEDSNSDSRIKATSIEEQREGMRTPGPDASAGLVSVFNYSTPDKNTIEIPEIMSALREVPDYQEGINGNTSENMEIDPTNPPVQKVHVDGVHTFMSMMLCMPHRMREKVDPSSLLSFALHLCNENNLKLVQDKSKKNWMTDFLILNGDENLPNGLELGIEDEADELWKETHDPCASVAKNNRENEEKRNEKGREGRIKLVAKKRLGKAPQATAETRKLNLIEEEDDEVSL